MNNQKKGVISQVSTQQNPQQNMTSLTTTIVVCCFALIVILTTKQKASDTVELQPTQPQISNENTINSTQQEITFSGDIDPGVKDLMGITVETLTNQRNDPEPLVYGVNFGNTKTDLEEQLANIYAGVFESDREKIVEAANRLREISGSDAEQARQTIDEAAWLLKTKAEQNINLSVQQNAGVITSCLYGLDGLGYTDLADQLFDNAKNSLDAQVALNNNPNTASTPAPNNLDGQAGQVTTKDELIEFQDNYNRSATAFLGNFNGISATSSAIAWNVFDLITALNGLEMYSREWAVIAVEKAPLALLNYLDKVLPGSSIRLDVWHIFITPLKENVYPSVNILDSGQNDINVPDRPWAPYVSWEGTDSQKVKWVRIVYIGLFEPNLFPGDLIKVDTITGKVVRFIRNFGK